MRIAHRNWMSFTAALLAVAGSWFLAAPAVSAPLNLTQQFPDILVWDLDIAYDAGTGSFTANQTPSAWFEYSPDGISSSGAGDWTYALTASLDSNGGLTSGSLEIQDGSSSTQLAGNLTAFGHFDDTQGDNDLFEFLFDVTGGDLAGDFGALGGIIIRTGSSSFAGDFSTDFTAVSSSSDTFAAVVPVPAAVWLFGSGLLGLAAAARRRQH